MQLPLLERRTAELETCAFCPKLSRAACPVSDADGRETTTPWGKMSAAFLLSRGAVEASAEQAWPPWACTGCFACRESCDLRNDVAGTLLDAGAKTLVVGDAGCPHTIVRRWGEVGAALAASVEVVHLSELAARNLRELPALAERDRTALIGAAGAASATPTAVRYHDACTLG